MTARPYLMFAAVALPVMIVLFLFRQHLVSKVDDILVEGVGLLCDILLFGIIISVYEKWRQRRETIRRYHEQFTDFCTWKDDEGVLRKVGIIKRLNELKAPLPDSIWGLVLTGADLYGMNLKGARFDFARLEGANLMYADLSRSNLYDSHLEKADFSMSVLAEANLSNSRLVGACLYCANLTGASLKEADLSNADLEHAILDDVDLTGAILDGIDLRGLYFKEYGENAERSDLRKVKGLTWAQLEKTQWDEKTKLPDYLLLQRDGIKDEDAQLTGE